MLYVVCALVVLTVILLPGEALAWGPVTHLVHGSEILRDVTTLAGGLQQMLAANPGEYLYGCVGADITQARRYARGVHSHCHSWRVGWEVWHQAHTDRLRAFAAGYLSHLASDIFAHNYFVPAQLLLSYRSRALGHAYWEARFDALQEAGEWETLRTVLSRRYPHCDRLVAAVVERTLFSFRTNKRIFDSMMTLHRIEHWQRLMRRVAARSRYPLAAADAQLYNRVCVETIRDLLTCGERSACQASDPVGREAISRATAIRRKLRTLRSRGGAVPPEEEVRHRLVPVLRAALRHRAA